MKVGDTIFYPLHGVAKVASKETRNFGGHDAEFFILELSRGGRSLVPIGNVDQEGIRPLISANKARSLLKQLKERPELENKLGWKERAAIYTEGLRTGASDRYTDILQELLYRAAEDKLTSSEQRTLETARGYFVGEVATVLNKEPAQLERQLAGVARAELVPS